MGRAGGAHYVHSPSCGIISKYSKWYSCAIIMVYTAAVTYSTYLLAKLAGGSPPHEHGQHRLQPPHFHKPGKRNTRQNNTTTHSTRQQNIRGRTQARRKIDQTRSDQRRGQRKRQRQRRATIHE